MARYAYRVGRPIRDLRIVRGADIVAVEPIPAEIDEPPAAVEEPDAPDYASMLKSELVALAESLGLDTSGTKVDIIARLSDG